MIFKIFIKSGLDHGLDLIWEDIFNSGNCGEQPSKGVKVLCGDSMGTEGCASGRLDVLYYLSGSVWKLIFSKNQVLEPSGFEPV